MIVYIKASGGGMVIISSILFSVVLCNSEAAKISVLNELVNVFSQISGDIRLGFSSLPAAFKNIYEHSENDLIINLFKALCDDLDDKENDNFSTVFNKNIDKYLRNILQEKDCELIKEFGLLPVHLDAIMQINYIDELVLRIRRKIEEYSKVSAVKCRMYRTLCLCGGLMIIIILI